MVCNYHQNLPCMELWQLLCLRSCCLPYLKSFILKSLIRMATLSREVTLVFSFFQSQQRLALKGKNLLPTELILFGRTPHQGNKQKITYVVSYMFPFIFAS